MKDRKLALLGTLGMLASPMLLVEGVRYDFAQAGTDFAGAILEIIYLLGWAATLVGLRRMRAAGDSVESWTLFITQLFFLAFATLWTARYLFAAEPGQSFLWTLGDAAWPLSHLLMLGLGGQIVRARRLTGWRRLAAIVPGLALPAFALLMIVGVPRGIAGASFGVLTAIGFYATGLVVRTAGRESASQETAATTRELRAAPTSYLDARRRISV